MPIAALTPQVAVDRLVDRSAEIRAALMLESGAVVAERGCPEGERAPALGDLARDLLEHADRASGGAEEVAQVEVGTLTGTVFALRETATREGAGRAVAVVAERFALPSLVLYDLLMTVRELRSVAA